MRGVSGDDGGLALGVSQSGLPDGPIAVAGSYSEEALRAGLDLDPTRIQLRRFCGSETDVIQTLDGSHVNNC